MQHTTNLKSHPPNSLIINFLIWLELTCGNADEVANKHPETFIYSLNTRQNIWEINFCFYLNT